MLMTPEALRALEVRRGRLIQMFDGCVRRPDLFRIYATPLSRRHKTSDLPEKFGLGGLPDSAIEGGISADFMTLVHLASSEKQEPPDDVRFRRLWKDIRERAHDAALAFRQRLYLERMVRLGSSRIRVPAQAEQTGGTL